MNVELLEKIILYICIEFPYKNNLSITRLTSIVYLADWKYALEYERVLIGKWLFNFHGCCVPDILHYVQHCSDIEIEYDAPIFIRTRKNVQKPILEDDVAVVLDFAIGKAKERMDVELYQLVYSTYPLFTQPRNIMLDLVTLAKKEKQ